MKLDLANKIVLILFIIIIIASIYYKNISSMIGWSNALMWFLIAQYALGRKNDG